MLTSFGFSDGAPSASLAAAELPERDDTWLRSHGCVGPTRTDLRLDQTTGELSQAALRAAVRCIRLQLYEPDESAWALEVGHFDAPWGGVRGLEAERHTPAGELVGKMLSAVLVNDLRIADNTAQMCRQALTDEQRAEQDVRLPEASADMRDAIREERVALDACADGFARASAEVQARGDELFG